MLKMCGTCNNEFSTYDKRRKYCSELCYHNNSETMSRLAKFNSEKRGSGKHRCESCGGLVDGGRKYCLTCYCDVLQKLPFVQCSVCGATIRNPAPGRSHCSFACAKLDRVYKIPKSKCSICECEIIGKRYRKYCDECWKHVMSVTYRKVDKNQSEIVKAIEKCGCSVLDLSSVGKGCPDIAASGRDGRIHLIEIKNPESKGKLNPRQKKWHEEWKGEKPFVVYNIEDALRALGCID